MDEPDTPRAVPTFDEDAIRLGSLRNDPEDVARLGEWAANAQRGAGCYFAWLDQAAVVQRYSAPHYYVQRSPTGWVVYACDDDTGANRRQLIGNASELIGRPAQDPSKRRGVLQQNLGYVAPPPPPASGATRWLCTSCDEVFEGPNTCRGEPAAMNCRRHCDERHFVQSVDEIRRRARRPRRGDGVSYEIWYHVDGGRTSVFGEWYSRVGVLEE